MATRTFRRGRAEGWKALLAVGGKLGLAEGVEGAALDEGDGETLHVHRIQQTEVLPPPHPAPL
jgi:hypothetical protein